MATEMAVELIAYTSNHCLTTVILPEGRPNNNPTTWRHALLFHEREGHPAVGLNADYRPLSGGYELIANGHRLVAARLPSNARGYTWYQRDESHGNNWQPAILRPLDPEHFAFDMRPGNRLLVMSQPRTIWWAGRITATDEIVAITTVDSDMASAQLFTGHRTDGYMERRRILQLADDPTDPRQFVIVAGSRRLVTEDAAEYRRRQKFWQRRKLPRNGQRITWGDHVVEPIDPTSHRFELDQPGGKIVFPPLLR